MKDLDAVKAAIVLVTTLLGSGGALGLWKLFTSDFLKPYREDQADLRSRLIAAEERADRADEKAQKADEKADEAVAATRKCEEREAHLRVALIAAGIDVGETP